MPDSAAGRKMPPTGAARDLLNSSAGTRRNERYQRLLAELDLKPKFLTDELARFLWWIAHLDAPTTERTIELIRASSHAKQEE